MFYNPNTTGFSSLKEVESIAKLYPNPAQDHTTIELVEPLSNAVLKIFDMRGKLVLEKKISGLSKRVNTSGLRAGAYIVLLEADNLISTSRLLKQ